jgi:hypothetical protein
MSDNKSGTQYEVLTPWAEADPVLLRGISPRLTDLNNKKIGILCNIKKAARPILTYFEKKLKEKYPTAEIIWYPGSSMSISELEPQNKAKFEEWIKGVDAVIAAVGD